MTRQIDDIREDIVNESRDYDVVLQMVNRLMIDADTFAPGADEVFHLMRDRLYGLYKELAVAIKERKSLQSGAAREKRTL